MEADYWKSRWQRGETGWHRGEVMPLLQKHWSALQAKPGTGVLVPLSGKTLDMPWLAAQGHRVLGIELSATGIAEFFAEHEPAPYFATVLVAPARTETGGRL